MSRRRARARLAPGGLAIVNQAALDLRRRADHRAEMTSQLLMGEVVRLLEAGRSLRAGWWRVENRTDRYRGWVRGWGLAPVTGELADRWLARSIPVTAIRSDARSGAGSGGLVTPLFWGARVLPGRRRRGFRAARLPDGRAVYLRAEDLSCPPPRLTDRVRQLIGIPYLWGGRTPMGFDCSGLSQRLLAERGVELPRDTTQQIGACRPLGRSETPRAGDLVFFRGRRGEVSHVGVGLGGQRFAHARGVVRISSNQRGNRLYDSDLRGTSMGWYRPMVGRP